MHCTERIPAKTNVNEAAFPERIRLGALDPYAHGRWHRGRVHHDILDRLGTVNPDARRKAKNPREQAAQNIM